MKLRLLFLLNLLLNSLCVTATPLGTAFTYQGRLSDGGAPASGIYDLRFAIYDSTNNAGGIVASPLTNSAVTVSNGLFTTTLDFGEGVFDAADRWLEIGVRTNGSVGAFTALSPRQPLTPAPYALYAPNAGAAKTATTALTANGVSAANILGTIPDARLSPNVALLNGNANFAGAVTAAAYNGSGEGLTNVPAGSLTGTIPDAQLSANIPQLNVPNTALQATGTPVVTAGFITAATVTGGGSGYVTPPAVTVNDTTGTGAVITAAISADGAVSNLTVLNAGTGYSATATLTIAPPPSNAYQVFASSNYFSGVNLLTNVNNVIAGSFIGNGAGLTSLDASKLTAGTVPDARLASNVARTSQVWLLDGNSGSNPTNDFLGTVDNQPLELRVNNTRALRLEPTVEDANHSIIVNVLGGSPVNYVAPGTYGATVSGGGAGYYAGGPGTNSVSADFGTVGGGSQNTIQDAALYATIGGGVKNAIQANAEFATIAGGEFHTIFASRGTVAGGDRNTIQTGADWGTIAGGQFNLEANAPFAFIGGGYLNAIRAQYSTIGGGGENTILAGADYATVPGGLLNLAAGGFSFAAGHQAKANHQGAFVWADSQNADFASQRNDQFRIRANGGVRFDINNNHYVEVFRQTIGISSFLIPIVIKTSTGAYLSEGGAWVDSSDRNLKENFQPVDVRTILERVVALPVTRWNYKAEGSSIQHLGPVAQDFQSTFGLSVDDKHIAPLDASGVALAAIQGLNQKVEERLQQKETEIMELKLRLEKIEQVMNQKNRGAK